MFQYTSTTLINDASMLIENAEALVVKGCPALKHDGIVEAREQKYAAAVAPKAEVLLSKATGASEVYRIAIQLRVTDQESIYANDFGVSGKPLYVEFKSGATAAEVVKAIKKHELFVCGQTLVEATASSSNKVTLTGKEGEQFLRFEAVELQKLVAGDPYNSWEVVAGGAEVKAKGSEAFGDYEHILKDLRLPSIENVRWTSPNADEMPVKGAKYHQFIIDYKKEVGHRGMQHVGEVLTACTTHLFWVKEELVEDFKDAVKVTVVPAVSEPTVDNGSNNGSEGGDFPV